MISKKVLSKLILTEVLRRNKEVIRSISIRGFGVIIIVNTWRI